MVKEIPVVWLQGAGCSGCAVSVLNAVAPDIRQVLLDQIVPGAHVNLRFQPTLMAGQGEPAIKVLLDTRKQKKGEYVFVMEGAVQTGAGGAFCEIGERDGKPVTCLDEAIALARDALAVIALGTCAAYGGIPAGDPNPTGAKGMAELLSSEKIKTPVINLPGCPVHPDWFTSTVVSLALRGLPSADALDEVGRPKEIYGGLIHENCPRRAAFDSGKFAENLSDDGCLYMLGCKGPQTSADCPLRQWNGGVNWCVGAGAPCNGCVEPEFPDRTSPLYEKIDDEALDRLKVSAR